MCLAGVPASEAYMCMAAVLVYEVAGNNSGTQARRSSSVRMMMRRRTGRRTSSVAGNRSRLINATRTPSQSSSSWRERGCKRDGKAAPTRPQATKDECRSMSVQSQWAVVESISSVGHVGSSEIGSLELSDHSWNDSPPYASVAGGRHAHERQEVWRTTFNRSSLTPVVHSNAAPLSPAVLMLVLVFGTDRCVFRAPVVIGRRLLSAALRDRDLARRRCAACAPLAMEERGRRGEAE